jgi:YbbR domain-containing protein
MSRRGTLLDYVHKTFTYNIGTKLISVLLAFILWGIVLGSRNIEVIKEIPIELITPSDVMPSSEVPEKIAFRLSGPKAFLRSILDRRDEPIKVNLMGVKPALVTYRFFADNIRVPIGVKVMSVTPTAILIKLENVKMKDVPVRVETRGVLPEGYRLAQVNVNPEIVRLKGPESKIESVSEVSTVPIDISSLKRNFEKDVNLDLSRLGVQLEGAPPRVNIEVQPTSANFSVKNVDIRVISSYKVKLEEKAVTVLVRATPQDMESLDRSHIFAEVDMTGKEKGKYIEPIRIFLPKEMGLVRVIPEKVHVTLY